MKEVGSVFPLYNEDISSNLKTPSFDKDRKYISLCREALSIIAEQEFSNNCTVMLPAYTCDTVITPFLEKKWQCIFYPINKDLTINIDATLNLYKNHNVNLFLIHPYCGMDLNFHELDLISKLKSNNCKIVIDLTQCIFTNQEIPNVDYYVASYRKWYQVPDGAYLQSSNIIELKPLTENTAFVNLQRDSMYLRGVYFKSKEENLKQISISLNKMASDMVNFNIEPHCMSSTSYNIMQNIDMDFVCQTRIENYRYLHHHLSKSKSCEVVCKDIDKISSAPLYFLIYSSNRKSLQEKLALNKIYAPILWPVYYEQVLIDETTRDIYNKILAIPIDQRYTIKEMERIVNCINLL